MNRSRIVLLIEDNPDDIELTMRAFRKVRLANELVVVRDGEEALHYLFGSGPYENRDTSIQPLLILLDLQLPKIDGMEVLRRLRADARTRRLPVVVLTSSREDRDIAASYDLGANSFIQKPVDFTEFLDATHQLGIYWLIMNQPPPPSR